MNIDIDIDIDKNKMLSNKANGNNIIRALEIETDSNSNSTSTSNSNSNSNSDIDSSGNNTKNDGTFNIFVSVLEVDSIVRQTIGEFEPDLYYKLSVINKFWSLKKPGSDVLSFIKTFNLQKRYLNDVNINQLIWGNDNNSNNEDIINMKLNEIPIKDIYTDATVNQKKMMLCALKVKQKIRRKFSDFTLYIENNSPLSSADAKFDKSDEKMKNTDSNIGFISCLSSLEKLNLNYNNISTTGIRNLSENGLQFLSKRLKSLELAHNLFDDYGLEYFLIHGLHKLPCLEELNLNGNTLSFCGLRCLTDTTIAVDAIADGIDTLVDASTAVWPNSMGTMGTGLDTGLDTDADITNPSVTTAVTSTDHNDNIHRMRLIDKQHTSIDIAQNFKSLKALYFRENFLKDQGIKILACNIFKFAPKLEILDIGLTRFSEIGATFLGENLYHLKNLKRLSVDNNNIGDVGIRKFLMSIEKPSSPISEFNLIHLDLKATGISDEGLICLVRDGLKKRFLRSLQNLNLAGNRIGNEGIKCFAEEGLPAILNGGLIELDISDNRITEEGTEVCLSASSCQYLNNLKKLNVGYNKISDVGINLFADEGIHCLTSLTELNLRQTNIDYSGLKILAKSKGFQSLKFLVNLDVRNNIKKLNPRIFEGCEDDEEKEANTKYETRDSIVNEFIKKYNTPTLIEMLANLGYDQFGRPNPSFNGNKDEVIAADRDTI